MEPVRNILVTGANGQLGRAMMRVPEVQGLRLVGMARDRLDLAREDALDRVVASGGFDAVVNTAAYTAVDRAETNAPQAFAINHTGAANLAGVCARYGVVLVHVSTDYVFDGTKPDPYSEVDPVNPGTVYGHSKAAGEAEIRSALDRHIILRTAWLFGPDTPNFVTKILQRARESDELSIVADQHGNPTSADDLAEAIMRLLGTLLLHGGADDARLWGTYHCTNSESATWCELAREVVARGAGGLARTPAIRPVATAEYPTDARRPANSRLDCGKLDQNFGIRLRPWKEAVASVVTQIAEG